MSYATVADAALAVLRLARGFSERNSARDDWRVLDSSGTYSAVVFQAGDTQEADSFDSHAESGKRQQQHEIGVTVAAQIGQDDDAAALDGLHTVIDTLMTHFRAYPRLDATSGVQYAEPTRAARPRIIARATAPNSGTHWASTIVLRVFEEVDAGWTESAQ